MKNCLIDYIRKANSEKGAYDLFEKQLEDLAQYFIKCDKENPTAYLEKYQKLVSSSKEEIVAEKEPSTSVSVEPNLVSTQIDSNNQSHIRKADNSSHTDTLLENKLNEPSIISEVPVCKRCGAPMVKKTAKRGDNKGNQFWGCSRFPKCRFILNIEDKEVL